MLEKGGQDEAEQNISKNENKEEGLFDESVVFKILVQYFQAWVFILELLELFGVLFQGLVFFDEPKMEDKSEDQNDEEDYGDYEAERSQKS